MGKGAWRIGNCSSAVNIESHQPFDDGVTLGLASRRTRPPSLSSLLGMRFHRAGVKSAVSCHT
jgi:hypothetical protein